MSNWELELQNEQERVDTVIEKVEAEQQKLGEQVGSVRTEIVSIRKDFWDDVTVNLDNEDEAIETAASMRQQAEVLSERERTHRQAYNQHKLLMKLKENPYFGRIDFVEQGDQAAEQVYLGIGSFYDKESEQFLIYDWRAPISSLYYDYSIGPAQYQAPTSTITGELALKRQFVIRSGQIRSMFDTGITIGDELLQQVLGRNASDQMKSIVATIQREQNLIIRNEKSKLLLVQGTAGSGKTSAALQRVAFLLYQNRETLTADQIILFSPNQMFNSYVANVLPELGEENMQQTTFQQYIEHMIGKKYKLENPFDQLEYLLTAGQDEAFRIRMDGIMYKSSLRFMKTIDQFVERLRYEGMIFRSLKFKGRVLIDAEAISSYFYSLSPNQSIPNRLQDVTSWLIRELKKLEKREIQEDWVEQEIQFLDKEEYDKFYKKLMSNKQFSEDTFDDFDREQKLLAQYVVRQHFKPLFRRVRSLAYIQVASMYKELLAWAVTQGDVPQNWPSICEQALARMDEKQMAYEDATPYLYFKELLEGFKSNKLVRYVFIDEAQDYSPFQIAFIKQLFPRARWTMLGDGNQTIFPHEGGLTDISTLFPDDTQETIRLYRSYRSTRPIVEYTKQLLPDGEAIEAFNRDGSKPLVISVESEEALTGAIVEQVKAFEADGHQTIAIICKTVQEARSAAERIGDRLPFRLVEKESSSYSKGLVIIPTYLAKGIEFDAVVIYNASAEQFNDEGERNLFYTACTRAMHELTIFHAGEPTAFMQGVSQELFEVKSL